MAIGKVIEKYPLAALAGLLALCLLPFVNNAFFMDDAYELHKAREARQTIKSMGGMFGGSKETAPRLGMPEDQHPRLPAFTLGLWTGLFGESETAIHFWFLLIALVSVWSMYFFASAYTDHPFFAAFLLTVSPAFWINHLHLYGDNLFLAFALLTFVAFQRFLKKPSLIWALLAMGSCLCAGLCRYHALLFIPVMGLFLFFRRRELFFSRWTIAALLIWAVPIALLMQHEYRTYGTLHLFQSFRARTGAMDFKLMFIPVLFVGGSLGFPWLVPFLFRRNPKSFLASLLPAAILVFFLVSPMGGFSINESLGMGLLFAAGFFAIVMCLRQFSWTDDRVLLWIWFVLGMLFIERFLARTAARHLFLILPPFIVLFVTSLERENFFSRPRIVLTVAAGLFAVSLALSCTDYIQSSVNRRVANDVSVWQTSAGLGAMGEGASLFYWGNDFMGYSYYLKQKGWKPYDPGTKLPAGGYVLVPWLYNTTGRWEETGNAQPVQTFLYESRWPLRVFSPLASAGFHSASWGAMPFAFAPGVLERFVLYRINPSE